MLNRTSERNGNELLLLLFLLVPGLFREELSLLTHLIGPSSLGRTPTSFQFSPTCCDDISMMGLNFDVPFLFREVLTSRGSSENFSPRGF